MDDFLVEQPDSSLEEPSLPIAELLLNIWDKRYLLLKVTLAALLLGYASSFLFRTEYTSTAQLMPPDAQTVATSSALNAFNGANLVPSLSGGFMSQRTPGSTVIGIMSSSALMDNIIDHFDLRREYKCKYYVDAQRLLSEHTILDEDKKSGIVSISVTDRDPRRARDITQAYVDQLNSLLSTLNTSSAHRERMFLEDRLKSLKAEMDDSSIELSQFSSRNATINPQVQGQALFSAAAGLQSQLVSAQSDLSALKTEYSPDNVRVKSAQAKVDELQSALRRMGSAPSETPSNNLQSGQLYPSLRDLPLLGVTYTNLMRKLTTEETIYDTLTKQYELAKVDEAKELPAVKLLDSPRVPERKSFPRRSMFAAVQGFLGAFGLSFYIAALKLWKLTPMSLLEKQ